MILSYENIYFKFLFGDKKIDGIKLPDTSGLKT